jgi:hypothetical protein
MIANVQQPTIELLRRRLGVFDAHEIVRSEWTCRAARSPECRTVIYKLGRDFSHPQKLSRLLETYRSVAWTDGGRSSELNCVKQLEAAMHSGKQRKARAAVQYSSGQMRLLARRLVPS